MNEITPFNFNEIEVRVIKDENNEPWFVAKDICDVLELSNSRKALSSLDDDEKGVTISDTLGGKQQISTVNESGMYSLIMRSRKPQAKKFRKWVTSEVLPTIRKTGSYNLIETIPSELDFRKVRHDAEDMIALGRSFGLKDENVFLISNKIIKERHGFDYLGMLKSEKIFDTTPVEIPAEIPVEKKEICMNATELGERFSMSAQKINKILEFLGYILPVRRAGKIKKWIPTEKGKEHTIVRNTGKTKLNGKPITQMFYRESLIPVISETA